MIMNESLLNTRGKEIVVLIENYFKSLNFGEFTVYVDFGEPHSIEFKNDLFRFVMYHKPEDEVEEQIQIPTIIFDHTIRHKGLFRGLMNVIIKFCHENGDIPILFIKIVVENFAEKLINEYHGVIVEDNPKSGYYIFVLPSVNI